MKQKYLILNNDDQKELIIREFAELDDKEALLLLGEQKFDVKYINSAIKKGKKSLIFVLRTENLYPPSVYADKIAESVISMFKEKKQFIELVFDDIDLLTKKKKESDTFKDVEKKVNEIDEIDKIDKIDKIDELLEDDFKEKFDDKLIEKESLIVEDDESL